MIKIGDFSEKIPANCQIFVESQVDFSVVEVDEKDKPILLVGNSQGRKFNTVTRRDCILKFLVGKYMHTEFDARPVKPAHEVVSDIPVEVPDMQPLSLTDSIKSFCAQLVTERYGRDSEEVDAFEEAFDFDIEDGDDDPVGS